MPYMIAGDIAAIQSYIFASPRLREMTGASTILQCFDRKILRQIVEDHEGKLVFSGGGNFLAIVDKDPEGVLNEIQKELHRISGEAQIVTAQIEFDQAIDDLFKIKEELIKLLEKKKSGGNRLQQVLDYPYLYVCDSCARFPAEEIIVEKNEKERICRSCYLKREARVTSNRLGNVGGKPWPGFREKFIESIGGDQLTIFPEYFEQIARNSTGMKEYMGVVFADANGMGKINKELFEEFRRLSSGNWQRIYREFSEGIKNTIKESLTDTLRDIFDINDKLKQLNYFAPGSRESDILIEELSELPFQVIILGGDDVLVVVPSSLALEFATKFIEEFTEKSSVIIDKIRKDADGISLSFDKIGMSAGVVICKSTLPFVSAHGLAEELIKSAKRMARDKGLDNTFDYEIVTSPSVEKLSDIRQKIEVRHKDDFIGIFTAKPYSTEDYNNIKETVGEIKEAGVSRTYLNQLRRIFSPLEVPYNCEFADVNKGKIPRITLHMYKRWLRRSPLDADKDVLSFFNVSQDLVKELPEIIGAKQRMNTKVYGYPVADVAELYDYLEAIV